MSALSNRIKSTTRLIQQLPTQSGGDSGGGAEWVTIGSKLQYPMYLLGDCDESGGTSIDMDDLSIAIGIYTGGTSNVLQDVLADFDMNGVVDMTDVSLIQNAFINSTKNSIITYATAFEYADAAVGDFVSVYLAGTNGHIYPAYAYVRKAGVVGIYSNEKIPVEATGEIKLLKA